MLLIDIIDTIFKYLSTVTQIMYTVTNKSIIKNTIKYSDALNFKCMNKELNAYLTTKYLPKIKFTIDYKELQENKILRYSATTNFEQYTYLMKFVNYILHIPIICNLHIYSSICYKCDHYLKTIVVIFMIRGYTVKNIHQVIDKYQNCVINILNIVDN